jgi:hypothetical protein
VDSFIGMRIKRNFKKEIILTIITIISKITIIIMRDIKMGIINIVMTLPINDIIIIIMVTDIINIIMKLETINIIKY